MSEELAQQAGLSGCGGGPAVRNGMTIARPDHGTADEIQAWPRGPASTTARAMEPVRVLAARHARDGDIRGRRAR